jgi:hypothetical protein
VFFGNSLHGKIKSCNLNPDVSHFAPEINIGDKVLSKEEEGKRENSEGMKGIKK